MAVFKRPALLLVVGSISLFGDATGHQDKEDAFSRDGKNHVDDKPGQKNYDNIMAKIFALMEDPDITNFDVIEGYVQGDEESSLEEASEVKCGRKAVRLWKFCINGNPEVGNDGEHSFDLASEPYFPPAEERLVSLKEGLCSDLTKREVTQIEAKPSWKSVASHRDLNVATTEFDWFGGRNRYNIDIADWNDEGCKIYEVRGSVTFKEERRHSSCVKVAASFKFLGNISGSFDRCTNWSAPAESYEFHLEVLSFSPIRAHSDNSLCLAHEVHGKTLVLEKCNGGPNQEFAIELTPNESHIIHSGKDPNSCLGHEQKPFQFEKCHINPYWWRMTDDGKIRLASNGSRCLLRKDTVTHGACPSAGSVRRSWIIEYDDARRFFRIKSRINTAMCLTFKDQLMLFETCNSETDDQKFEIEDVGVGIGPSIKIKSKSNIGQCLGDGAEGNPLKFTDCSGTYWWAKEPFNDGVIKPDAVQSECIYVDSVKLGACLGDDDARWSFTGNNQENEG